MNKRPQPLLASSSIEFVLAFGGGGTMLGRVAESRDRRLECSIISTSFVLR
jgi:hypothetical protein